MSVVWKFPLDMRPDQTVEMPAGAVVLHAAHQASVAYVWALVDPGAPTVPRRLWVLGTGSPVPVGVIGVHVSTFFIGDLVLHVFDLGELL